MMEIAESRICFIMILISKENRKNVCLRPGKVKSKKKKAANNSQPNLRNLLKIYLPAFSNLYNAEISSADNGLL
jgi:hypothetical protein